MLKQNISGLIFSWATTTSTALAWMGNVETILVIVTGIFSLALTSVYIIKGIFDVRKAWREDRKAERESKKPLT